jgi:hypothetical protein
MILIIKKMTLLNDYSLSCSSYKTTTRIPLPPLKRHLAVSKEHPLQEKLFVLNGSEIIAIYGSYIFWLIFVAKLIDQALLKAKNFLSDMINIL